MKIKGAELAYIYSKLDSVVDSIGREKVMAYKVGLKNDSRVKDLEQRFRWDLFWAAKVRIGDGMGIAGDITITGCNDSHIDTVLRQYVASRGL